MLGPLYFSYRGYLVLGIIAVLLDYILVYYVGNHISHIIWFYLYIFFNRILYSKFANSICLLIDNIKIKYIIKFNKDNYLEKLREHKHRKICLFFTIIFYFIAILVFGLIRRYKNGLL